MSGESTTNEETHGPVSGEDYARVCDERDDLQNRLMRLAADLDNIRKRTHREIEAGRTRERESILRSMIEVIDNFERALSAAGAEQNEWLEGLEGIRLQMLEVLRRHGARAFEAGGAKFDPQRHEALAAVSIPNTEDGIVVEVIQIGYEFEDGAVLRPAKVVVNRIADAQ